MEKKSKAKKIVLGCFAIVIIVILVVVGTVLYVLSAIFEGQPADIVVKIPEVKPLQSATEKLFKTLGGESVISSSTNLEDINLESLGLSGLDAGNIDLNNLENLDLKELLKKVDLEKVMGALAKPGKLTLTKAEVNALIASYFTADMVADLQNSEKPKIYDAWFEDGRFTVKLTTDSKIPTPFGSYCNIEIVFIPQVIDHHLKLDLCSAKLGDLSCPVSYLKDTIDSQLLVYEQSEDGKQLLELINSLKINEDEVVLEYDFQKLSLYLLDQQENLEFLNNSSDVSADEILKLFQ